MKAWAKPKPFLLLEPGTQLRRPEQAQSATGSKDKQHGAVFSMPLALLTAEVCSVTRPAKQAASRCLICDRGKATRAVSVHSELQFIFGRHLPWGWSEGTDPTEGLPSDKIRSAFTIIYVLW